MLPKHSLEWKNVTLQHNQSNKMILESLNGRVQSGEFLTVMGQSGAGKSSFLSIITARITKRTRGFDLQGETYLNGKKYGFSDFGKCAAYVRQDDILMGTLTVQETFQFQAKLKLHNLSEIEQQYKTNQIIKKLNLEECKKSLVGGQFSKSISGGQRKRVAIGVQLLADPNCLILDEPTSGLDSNNSLKLIKILKNLALDGRVIVATIHQPSTLMFLQMNKLMIMGKGKTLYFGNAQEVVPYMTSIGVQIDSKMNPADFYMLQISEYKNSKGYKTPMTPEAFINYSKNKIENKNEKEKQEEHNQQQFIWQNERKQPNIIKQLPILFKRSFKNFFRTISNLYGKVLVLIIIPLLLVTLYHDIGNNFPNVDEFDKFLKDMCAFIFMFVFFNFSMSVYDTVLAFPPEKQLVLKETSARLYSISAYYFCRCLVEIPITIAVGLASTTITYFLTGLDPTFGSYVKTSLATGLVGLSGYMFGSLVGIVFSTSQHAVQILPVIIIPLVLFGGLVVNLNSIPNYANWFQYFSPIRHVYSGIMVDQMSTQHFHKIIQIDNVKDILGVNGSYWQNLGYLCIIIILCSTASILVLYLKKKPV